MNIKDAAKIAYEGILTEKQIDKMIDNKKCECDECKKVPHKSDCSVHNMPAYPKGNCDCGAERPEILKAIHEKLLGIPKEWK